MNQPRELHNFQFIEPSFQFTEPKIAAAPCAQTLSCALCNCGPATLNSGRSTQPNLLHHLQKLTLIDLPIPVLVSLRDHLVKLVIRECLTQLDRNTLQILERQPPGFVVIQ
eukprot:TRINITY_DN23240_c0_g1_i1.p1 TRINITY_DN23240_c0_g1~~TRINITY_DN23240_c0_g1_i1.p1  ORF type:complete len:111 (-),score=10.56 TRINITY_DN23240_c0_g1_i1:274-606(-)